MFRLYVFVFIKFYFFFSFSFSKHLLRAAYSTIITYRVVWAYKFLYMFVFKLEFKSSLYDAPDINLCTTFKA